MPKKSPLPGRRRLSLETLETRTLLSASPLAGITAQPMLHATASSGGAPAGMSPAQIAQAYGFNQIQFSGAKGDGSGQTIAIVDAYDDPNIASDLTAFDQKFGLAAPPSFSKVYADGSRPRADSGWSQEISLDVEWAHAMAPKAKIVLVEANSANLGDLLNAVDTARNMPAVSVVSMSWGSSEFAGETSYDSYFTTPAGHQGITFVGSSGDSGAPGLWPALSNNVLAVGGTTLGLSGGGYGSETAWSNSGGGLSQYESEPAFQNNVQTTGSRSTPDVAYNADPNSGFAVYDSYGSGGWMVVGGTSAGAPQWAALVAIADQGLAQAGKGSLDGAQSRLYQLSSSDFHDVTVGDNGYSAGAGYDLATGLGSPLANLVVADLVSGTVDQPTPVTGGGSSGGGSNGGSGSGSNGPGGAFGGGSGGGYYDPFGGYSGYGYSGYGYDPWSWFFGGYGDDPFGSYFSGYSYDPWGAWGFGSSGRLSTLDVAATGGDAGSAASGAATGSNTASASTGAAAGASASAPMTESGSTASAVAAALPPADDGTGLSEGLSSGEITAAAADACFGDETLLRFDSEESVKNA
jgi:hypothetical protein